MQECCTVRQCLRFVTICFSKLFVFRLQHRVRSLRDSALWVWVPEAAVPRKLTRNLYAIRVFRNADRLFADTKAIWVVDSANAIQVIAFCLISINSTNFRQRRTNLRVWFGAARSRNGRATGRQMPSVSPKISFCLTLESCKSHSNNSFCPCSTQRAHQSLTNWF
jgi:hypothetical protein